MGRAGAGPGVILSFIVAAIACGFAALCYAELAAMIPVSGSAYTYSYATLGEIVAWTIGWDLIIEYAVGNMAVAVGWSDYFVKLLVSARNKFPPLGLFSIMAPRRQFRRGGDAVAVYSSHIAALFWTSFARNLPAFLIVAAVTAS